MINQIIYLIEQTEILMEKALPDIPMEERSMKNLPRYSNGKPRIKFQEWLGLKTEKGAVGKSPNGKWYGWSHRAIYGFSPGEVIKKEDSIGRDRSRKIPYTIKDDNDAKEHAKRFADEVS